jgi:hypothetical protein
MKSILLSILVGVILLTASCGNQESTSPLEEGTVVSGTLWDGPSGSSRSGNPITEGMKIRIHQSFVVLINDDGVKQIVPTDYITDLKIR